MTTYGVSHISARDLFISADNIGVIKDAIRMRRTGNFTRDQLANWYDRYMMAHKVEPSKIDDVQVWCDYMTTMFVRYWVGVHNVSAEQVPYVPYDLPEDVLEGRDRFGRPCMGAPEMKTNKPLIGCNQPSGRFPKLKLASAVEDGVDENGEIVIHNEHATIRVFQPITGTQGRGWRFGKNDPVTQKRIWGGRPSELQDSTYNGTLVDWELLNRPHTRYPMEQFFTTG